MALFNLRWPGRDAKDDGKRGARQRRASPTESVDALRRRARHRLIGAAVLLAAGVVGFPLLFDTQPRPIPVDIPITIPGQGLAVATPPAVVAAAPAATVVTPPAAAVASARPPVPATPSAPAGKSPASTASTADSLDRGEEVVASTTPKPTEKPIDKPTVPAIPPHPQSKPVEAPAHREPVASPKPAAVASASVPHDDDAARARALLDGKPLPAATVASATPAVGAVAGRFVVQVGAFADAGKAQEARNKLTRSGLQTYVQSVDTKDGKRIRVRVGPFANKADADRAAGKVKGLDLPASILTL
jgi:DedD protein